MMEPFTSPSGSNAPAREPFPGLIALIYTQKKVVFWIVKLYHSCLINIKDANLYQNIKGD